MIEGPSQVTGETYKRGQVEGALWGFYWLGRTSPAGVPPTPTIFRTRIKRLLDVDRAGELPYAQIETSCASYAFSEEKPGRQGVDVGFTAFDSFCLLIGLELLDAGFKQLEVVFLMRHLREFLREQFEAIEALGVLPYLDFWSVKRAPGLPVVRRGNSEVADHRVYALIQKLEIKEVFPLLAQPKKRVKGGKSKPSAPLILKPKFFRGIVALQEELDKAMPLHYRKTMLLELSLMASGISQLLRTTPAVKRGPK